MLILGGDITGKSVVPIVEREDGVLSCEFLGSSVELRTAQEEQEMVHKISNTGYYPYRTSVREMEELRTDQRKTQEVYVKLMGERLQTWLRLAETHLRDTGMKCFITGGNDDPLLIEEILHGSDLVVNPENSLVQVDQSHEMISCAYSNPTPWKTPRELPEEKLEDRIEALCSKVKIMENCIFNLHVPPMDSGIDTCPKLDTSQDPPKPVYMGGLPVMMGAGSRAVRNVIEKHQPLLSLHGHIHEARGVIRIGRTHCVNPGSEYGEGILRGAILNLNEKKVISYQCISG